MSVISAPVAESGAAAEGRGHFHGTGREYFRILARDTLALYTELVEHAIRGRDRRTYQQAVQYLKRMKAVYKAIDAVADWDNYLQLLRAQYRHLPALQDEMRQGRL